MVTVVQDADTCHEVAQESGVGFPDGRECARSSPMGASGSLEWRLGVHEWANLRRQAIGLGDLDTEPELHRRARALGVLRPISRPTRCARCAARGIGAFAALLYRAEPRETTDIDFLVTSMLGVAEAFRADGHAKTTLRRFWRRVRRSSSTTSSVGRLHGRSLTGGRRAVSAGCKPEESVRCEGVPGRFSVLQEAPCRVQEVSR